MQDQRKELLSSLYDQGYNYAVEEKMVPLSTSPIIKKTYILVKPKKLTVEEGEYDNLRHLVNGCGFKISITTDKMKIMFVIKEEE